MPKPNQAKPTEDLKEALKKSNQKRSEGVAPREWKEYDRAPAPPPKKDKK